MKKMGKFARIFFAVVGITGLGTAIWLFSNLDKFAKMGFFANVSFIVGLIAMLNWGIVAIMGDCKKDLFGLLGLIKR